MSQQPQQTRNMFLTAYGVGSGLGILAYSRTHESEADKLGVTFAAMAGYDPHAAVTFWQRMAAQSILAILNGKIPDTVVNPLAIPRWKERFSI